MMVSLSFFRSHTCLWALTWSSSAKYRPALSVASSAPNDRSWIIISWIFFPIEWRKSWSIILGMLSMILWSNIMISVNTVCREISLILNTPCSSHGSMRRFQPSRSVLLHKGQDPAIAPSLHPSGHQVQWLRVLIGHPWPLDHRWSLAADNCDVSTATKKITGDTSLDELPCIVKDTCLGKRRNNGRSAWKVGPLILTST